MSQTTAASEVAASERMLEETNDLKKKSLALLKENLATKHNMPSGLLNKKSKRTKA